MKTKTQNLVGMRFGKLTVLSRSDKRAPRGKRTVPLWECLCDCGAVTYKATDILKNADVSMCQDCAVQYATEKMRKAAGYLDGTQLSRITSLSKESNNRCGVRGVYYDKTTGRYRARLRFHGKLMNFGSYTRLEDAVAARHQAEEDYFGEFIKQIHKKS